MKCMTENVKKLLLVMGHEMVKFPFMVILGGALEFGGRMLQFVQALFGGLLTCVDPAGPTMSVCLFFLSQHAHCL